MRRADGIRTKVTKIRKITKKTQLVFLVIFVCFVILVPAAVGSSQRLPQEKFAASSVEPVPL